MAGVTQTKPPFAKNTDFATLNKNLNPTHSRDNPEKLFMFTSPPCDSITRIIHPERAHVTLGAIMAKSRNYQELSEMYSPRIVLCQVAAKTTDSSMLSYAKFTQLPSK